eukprot:5163808-Alexandrium_andersonii.AAC.1
MPPESLGENRLVDPGLRLRIGALCTSGFPGEHYRPHEQTGQERRHRRARAPQLSAYHRRPR